MRCALVLALFAASVIVLISCKGSSAKPSTERINVVVTIPPLADFARGVGGERVRVTTLLAPGASPHTFEPTPSQAGEASRARLVVRVGLELDHWVDGLLPEKTTTVTAGELPDIELLGDEDHGHKGVNPHIWLDPVYAKSIVTAIADSLIKLDPGNRTLFERNRDAYLARLDSLHARISERVSSFRIKTYVEFHPSWTYFGRRYGLRELAVIEESAGKEPTPRHIADVVQVVKKSKARVVFAEPQLSPKAAETIAREAGAKVLYLDPLGRPDEAYVDLMDRNLEVLTQALGAR